jgi:DNA-binding transcriptional LysR family regulator
MFTLEQLRGFVAVAEELHFGRAAERLQMTQPPLSRSIQKLERAVGAHLLERDNRRVELTTAGAVFLSEARRLLGLADSAVEQARRVQAGSAGTVRIGFTATSTFGILTRLLDFLGSSFPDVHLELRELVTKQQISALLGGELDLGLARPPFDTAAFASRLLHREDLILAVPREHRLAQRREVAPADLTNEPLIMYSPVEARYFYDLLVRLMPITDENVVHSVSQVMTVLWLVASGRGIAFVPESAARLGIPDVRFLGLVGLPAQPVELHLLWPREAHNPALRAILETLRQRRF